jgi:hypothetical protein
MNVRTFVMGLRGGWDGLGVFDLGGSFLEGVSRRDV